MTSTDLYEIVKDVPEAAWPDKTEFIGRLWHSDKLPLTLKLAEAAFVGSMVAWLIKEGRPSSFTLVDMGDFQRVQEYHDGTGYEILNNYDKPTLIQALAAACKEARP